MSRGKHCVLLKVGMISFLLPPPSLFHELFSRGVDLFSVCVRKVYARLAWFLRFLFFVLVALFDRFFHNFFLLDPDAFSSCLRRERIRWPAFEGHVSTRCPAFPHAVHKCFFCLFLFLLGTFARMALDMAARPSVLLEPKFRRCQCVCGWHLFFRTGLERNRRAAGWSHNPHII